MKPAITLYSDPASRAVMVQWYLLELGLEAEVVTMDIHHEPKDNLKPEYLQINPFGEVPTLKDGDFVLTESGAIIMYLAEKYGGVTDPQERAVLAKWIFFANTTVVYWDKENCRVRMSEKLGILDGILAEKEYVLGSFSAADVPMGSYLMYLAAWIKDLDFTPYPNVTRYITRLSERPGCASTHAMSLDFIKKPQATGCAAPQ